MGLLSTPDNAACLEVQEHRTLDWEGDPASEKKQHARPVATVSALAYVLMARTVHCGLTTPQPALGSEGSSLQ